MKTKKYWILAVALTVVLSCIVIVSSSTDGLKPRQHALVGLKGVSVWVDELRTDKENYGLSKERLQIDVELKLRQNGIKVFSEREVLQSPGAPVLSISVMHQPVVYKDLRKAPVCACSIHVQLIETMQLKRNPQIYCRASAWGHSMINAIPTEGFAENVRTGLSDLIDGFLNDYLAANPKESEKKKPTLQELLEETKPKDKKSIFD